MGGVHLQEVSVNGRIDCISKLELPPTPHTSPHDWRGRQTRAIDLFKVYAAILQGVQNYWGERAAKRKMQMATRLNSLLWCQKTLVVR